MMKRFTRFFSLSLICHWALPVSAQSYTPPSSPPLYAKEEPSLPPIKVKDSTSVKPFLNIGQSKSSGSESAATSVSYGLGLQYLKALGHWNILLAEADLIRGFAGHSRADLDMPYGLAVKAGYGFKLGQELYGIVGAGVLLFKARLTGEEEITSGLAQVTGDGVGNGALLYYKFGIPTSESSFLTVGVSSSFINSSFRDLRFAGGAKASSQNLALTVLTADFGCAFQF